MRLGARRPYITHAVELLGILNEVNTAITGIEDVLDASRAEQDAETAEAMQAELKQAYVYNTLFYLVRALRSMLILDEVWMPKN